MLKRKKMDENSYKRKKHRKVFIITILAVLLCFGIYMGTGLDLRNQTLFEYIGTKKNTPWKAPRKFGEDIPEPNTLSMISYIKECAKKDSQNFSEKEQEKALNFVANNYKQFFINNEMMEKTVYYANQLAAKESDFIPFSESITKVIEKIYTNSGSFDDDIVKLNLAKAKLELIKFRIVPDDIPIEEPSFGSEERIEYIEYQARIDTNNEMEQEALEFVINNYDDFLKDKEKMEKYVYYVNVLKFPDRRFYNIRELATMAIKRAYVNPETIDDDLTKLYMAKIKLNLINLNLVPDDISIEKPAPNSLEMVEYIDYSCMFADKMTEQETKNAIAFIKNNYPNYYTNNELMEKTMTYGNLLQWDWKNSDEIKLLGDYARNAVKDIYVNHYSIGTDKHKQNLEILKNQIDIVQNTPSKTFESDNIQSTTEPVQAYNPHMVWIPTNGGTKYHLDSGCSKMINPIKVTEDDAISKGFDMCKKCFR